LSAPPLIKICGMTDPADLAGWAGRVWAVGVVLAPESPRRVGVEDARAVMDALPSTVARVGVMVDPSPVEAAELVREIGLTQVQVHGEVDVAAVRAAAGVPVIQGFRVDGPLALRRARDSEADLVLLDASVPGRQGGTGRTFDWDLLDGTPLGRPFALAGGLTPQNVEAAVARARPSHVDVSSGVERAPRRKDPALVEAFIAAAGGPARRAA